MPGSMSQQLPLPYPVLAKARAETGSKSDSVAADDGSEEQQCTRRTPLQQALQVIRKAMSQPGASSQPVQHADHTQPCVQQVQPFMVANVGSQQQPMSSSSTADKDDGPDTATSPQTAGRPALMSSIALVNGSPTPSTQLQGQIAAPRPAPDHQGSADIQHGAAAATRSAQEAALGLPAVTSPKQQAMQLLEEAPGQWRGEEEATSPPDQQQVGPRQNHGTVMQHTLRLERSNSGTTTVCSPLTARDNAEVDAEMELRSTEVLPMLLLHASSDNAMDAAPTRVASSSGAHAGLAAPHSPISSAGTRKRKQMDVRLSMELALPCKMTVFDGTSRACSRASTPTSRDWCAAEAGAALPLMALLGQAAAANIAGGCHARYVAAGTETAMAPCNDAEDDAVMLSQSQAADVVPAAGADDVAGLGKSGHTVGCNSNSQQPNRTLRRGASRSSPGYTQSGINVAAADEQPLSPKCGAADSACTSNASLIRHARALHITEAVGPPAPMKATQPHGEGMVGAGVDLHIRPQHTCGPTDTATGHMCSGALVVEQAAIAAEKAGKLASNMNSSVGKEQVAQMAHVQWQQPLVLQADNQQIVPVAVLHEITERVRKELASEFEARVQAAVLHAREELEAGLLSKLQKKSKAKKQAKKSAGHKVVKQGLKQSPAQARTDSGGLQLAELQAQLEQAQAQLRALTEQQDAAKTDACAVPVPPFREAVPRGPVNPAPAITEQGSALDTTAIAVSPDHAKVAAAGADITTGGAAFPWAVQQGKPAGLLQDAVQLGVQNNADAPQWSTCADPALQPRPQQQEQDIVAGHVAMQIDNPALPVACMMETSFQLDDAVVQGDTSACAAASAHARQHAATMSNQKDSAVIAQMQGDGTAVLTSANQAEGQSKPPASPEDLQDAATQLLGWQLAHRHNPATPCNSDGSCPGSQVVTPTSFIECGSPVTGLLDSRTVEASSTGTGKRGKCNPSTGAKAQHDSTGVQAQHDSASASGNLPAGSTGVNSSVGHKLHPSAAGLGLNPQVMSYQKSSSLGSTMGSAGAVENQHQRVARGPSFISVLHSACTSPPSVHALFDGRLIVTDAAPDGPCSPDENAAAVPDLRPHIPGHHGITPFQDSTNLQLLRSNSLAVNQAQKGCAMLSKHNPQQLCSPTHALPAQPYMSAPRLQQPPLQLQQPVVTCVAQDSHGATTPSSTFGSNTSSPHTAAHAAAPRQLFSSTGAASAPVTKGRFNIITSPPQGVQAASWHAVPSPAGNGTTQGDWHTPTRNAHAHTNSSALGPKSAPAKLSKSNVLKAIEAAGRNGVTGLTLASQFALRGFPHSGDCIQLKDHLQALVEEMDVYRKPSPGAKATSMATGHVDITDASVCFAAM